MLNNFVVLDIECPNNANDSICSIAYVHIINNEIVKKKYELINPETNFSSRNVKINGINPYAIKDARTFDLFWQENKNIFTENFLVGHNVQYDLSVIGKDLLRYQIIPPKFKCYCTKTLSEKYIGGGEYSLKALCDKLNIQLTNHHNALEDTLATFELFKYLNNNYNIDDNILISSTNVSLRHSVSPINKGDLVIKEDDVFLKPKFSEETKGMQWFKDIVDKILKNGEININTIIALNKWIKMNNELSGNYPFDKIKAVVEDVLEDNIISLTEYDELMNLFNEFVDPVKKDQSHEKIDFKDKLFCLTGDFKYGTKDEIENLIVSKGGKRKDNITTKVNYLIVGGKGSEAWSMGNYGSKVKKAIEFNDCGKADIKIVHENEFIKQIEGWKEN